MCVVGEGWRACCKDMDTRKVVSSPWLEALQQRLHGTGFLHWLVEGMDKVISKVLSNCSFVAEFLVVSTPTLWPIRFAPSPSFLATVL